MCVENFGSHHSNNTCHGSKHTWQHFWRIIEKLMCYVLFCSAALVVPACSFHPDLAQSGVRLRSSIKESSFCWGNETANTHSPITSLTAAEPETRWRAIHMTCDGPPPPGQLWQSVKNCCNLRSLHWFFLSAHPGSRSIT